MIFCTMGLVSASVRILDNVIVSYTKNYRHVGFNFSQFIIIMQYTNSFWKEIIHALYPKI
jgi:hypothetical protein